MIGFTDIYQLKARLDKLKHELDKETANNYEKELANKYLNRAIDFVNELQLY